MGPSARAVEIKDMMISEISSGFQTLKSRTEDMFATQASRQRKTKRGSAIPESVEHKKKGSLPLQERTRNDKKLLEWKDLRESILFITEFYDRVINQLVLQLCGASKSSASCRMTRRRLERT